MTTAAMVLGVMPLIARERRGRRVALQHGHGDRQRAAIGTLFTLFVVPAVYMLLSGEKEAVVRTAPDAASSAAL